VEIPSLRSQAFPENTITNTFLPAGLAVPAQGSLYSSSGQAEVLPQQHAQDLTDAFKVLLYGMPGCIGAIDGTPGAYEVPALKHAPRDNAYWSFKSKIAMLLLASHADASPGVTAAPGSAGDAGVWNHSNFPQGQDRSRPPGTL
jgi:hypothetical protein